MLRMSKHGIKLASALLAQQHHKQAILQSSCTTAGAAQSAQHALLCCRSRFYISCVDTQDLASCYNSACAHRRRQCA